MTQVEVCNLALGWLGANTITSIDDDTTEARLCKASWVPTRDLLLESREWSFAIERIVIAPDATAPEFYWTKRFQIPSRVLRVLRCVDDNEENVDWQREGAYVVCFEDTLNMIALVRVEAMADLSTSFCHALAARLAADLAVPLVDSVSMQERMWKLFAVKMQEAATLDSMQGRSIQIKGPGLWKVR